MSARNKRKNPTNRLNAFDEKTNLEEVTDEIFGASPAPELNTGRVVARPTPIDEIWADVRQPRRAIPASIRLVWNGSPADVPDLLNTWGAVAANAAGRTINIPEIINGDGDGVDTDGTPPIYESFISLLRLAGSILREGLINPITIIDQRDRHLIESGERRWLAYWLLRLHTPAGDEFTRIPAATVSGTDFVFRQAAENTVRRSLNAVGMARQLALLIMEVRGQDQYAEYEQIVPPGGSDRRYYAQVADGNTHRIPKGAGERIESAMGLSKEQLSRYRDILRITPDDEINDALWLRGDIEDWPESAFRDVNRLPIGNLRTLLSLDSWSLSDIRTAVSTFTTVKVQPPAQPPAPQPGGAETEDANRVITQIRQGFQRVYALETSPDGTKQIAATRATRLLSQAQNYYERNRLASAQESIDEAVRILDEAAGADGSPATPTPPNPLVEQLGGIGATVQYRSGQTGTLVEINGRLATVDTPNGLKTYDALYLRKVDIPAKLSEPPKQNPTHSTSDHAMRRIYEFWRAKFDDDDLVLITQDGNTYIGIGTDDHILRFNIYPNVENWQESEVGHIGESGAADYMLVTKIDADLMSEVTGQYSGNVVVISYADLDEDMQYVAGTAFRARNISLNTLSDPDNDDDQDEPTQQPPDGKFAVGDLVNTKLGRTGGKIIAIDGKNVTVDFPGGPPFTTTIANIVFVERPAASDKSPSAGSQPSGRVVDYNTQQFTLLMQIRTLASVTGHKDIFDTIDNLLNLDWDAARQLTADGRLPDTLQSYFDGINNVLSEVSTTLGQFLDDLNQQLAE